MNIKFATYDRKTMDWLKWGHEKEEYYKHTQEILEQIRETFINGDECCCLHKIVPGTILGRCGLHLKPRAILPTLQRMFPDFTFFSYLNHDSIYYAISFTEDHQQLFDWTRENLNGI